MKIYAVRKLIQLSSRRANAAHLRVFELGCELEHPVEKLFVLAKERRLLRLAGHVEYAEHSDEENRDGSQNGNRHDLPGLDGVRVEGDVRDVSPETGVGGRTTTHGTDSLPAGDGLGPHSGCARALFGRVRERNESAPWAWTWRPVRGWKTFNQRRERPPSDGHRFFPSRCSSMIIIKTNATSRQGPESTARRLGRHCVRPVESWKITQNTRPDAGRGGDGRSE